ncbi:MAG: DUF1761 domain-containing protein [Proteobacteria bacterium]|nr:DUF1761 domain-containing protein [Pseudomonadota bacterium]
MEFAGLNYLAVPAAAIAGLAFGWIWYGLLFGDRWRSIVGIKTLDLKPVPIIVAAAAHWVMAWMLAGLLGHLGATSIRGAVISAAFLWFGFILATTIINHRMRASPWPQTAIESGHWLGVLLVMGLVLGLFGV